MAKVDVTKLTVEEVIVLRRDLDKHIQELMYSFKPNSNGSRMKGVKINPKYRGPNGETWAGRGQQPTWLAALLRKKGNTLEKYRIKQAR